MIPIRFGNLPKRAMIFRTETPFPKMTARLVDPSGKHHKIEILGDGQQLIVHGVHPATGEPYTYHGQPIWNVERVELVEVDEATMRELLEILAEMLRSELGWTPADGGSGQAGEHEPDQDPRPPVDVDELLAGAAPGDVNERTLKATGSLLRQGMSVEETTRTVLEALHRAIPGGSESEWRARQCEIEGQCYRLVNKHLDELADRLPDDMREKVERHRQAGKDPYLKFAARDGWHVRHDRPDQRRHKADGNGGVDPKEPAAGKVAIEALPFQRFDPSKLPAREWLYGGHYQRGIITATVGPGGSGKSSPDLVELIAMCTGRDLLGEQPLERCRAWYHNAEDGTDEIYRRIAAVCQHYGIDQAELEGWLFVTSGIHHADQDRRGAEWSRHDRGRHGRGDHPHRRRQRDRRRELRSPRGNARRD